MISQKKPQASPIKGIIVLVMLVITVVSCYQLLCNGPEKVKRIEEQGDMAYIMAQDFVKKQLKSPSSATFPGGSDQFSQYVGDSTFSIKSYVDSQNSFGAMMRTNYHAKLRYAGNDNWNLVEIKLEE